MRTQARAQVVTDEALLNAEEAAALARVHPSRWWGIAGKSRLLRAGCVRRPGRTFWLKTAVIAWMREGAGRDA